MTILYSFRRCPYAMRARMALAWSGIAVELREVRLRDKPPSMIALSPKATVPVLVSEQDGVLDESLEIMLWALLRHAPHRCALGGGVDHQRVLIEQFDAQFKPLLDQYKYNAAPHKYRHICVLFALISARYRHPPSQQQHGDHAHNSDNPLLHLSLPQLVPQDNCGDQATPSVCSCHGAYLPIIDVNNSCSSHSSSQRCKFS